MKQRFFIYTLFCLMAITMQAQGENGQKRCVVTDEKEFFAALASNSHIIIPEGMELNLSKVLKEEMTLNRMEIMPIENFEDISLINLQKGNVAYGEQYDGKEAILLKMENVTIESSGNFPARIVVEPRYAYVLSFIDCSNITLRNLEMGHTESGYCSGGVINLENCPDVIIDNCDLYGCGTEGITASRVNGLNVVNCFIHDCTYSIMTLRSCQNVTFEDCVFARNREFSLINAEAGLKNVHFKNCAFHSNNGPLFSLESRIKMTNCEITHADDKLGNIDMIEQNNCQWKAAFETPASPTEQHDNKANEKEEKVFYHSWKGVAGNKVLLLVYAQKGRVLLGEIQVKANGESSERIYQMHGYINSAGDILFYAYKKIAPTEIAFGYRGRKVGKEMHIFDESGQNYYKLNPAKGEGTYPIDREPDAYGSIFWSPRVYRFSATEGNIGGKYRYYSDESGDEGNVGLMLAGGNGNTLTCNIEAASGGEGALLEATSIPYNGTKPIVLEFERDQASLRLELRFYDGFIAIHTLEQRGNYWRKNFFDGIYVKNTQ